MDRMDAEDIYRSITEGEAPTKLQYVWDDYEDENGTIEIGSKIDNLIVALIEYTVGMTSED